MGCYMLRMWTNCDMVQNLVVRVTVTVFSSVHTWRHWCFLYSFLALKIHHLIGNFSICLTASRHTFLLHNLWDWAVGWMVQAYDDINNESLIKKVSTLYGRLQTIYSWNPFDPGFWAMQVWWLQQSFPFISHILFYPYRPSSSPSNECHSLCWIHWS